MLRSTEISYIFPIHCLGNVLHWHKVPGLPGYQVRHWQEESLEQSEKMNLLWFNCGDTAGVTHCICWRTRIFSGFLWKQQEMYLTTHVRRFGPVFHDVTHHFQPHCSGPPSTHPLCKLIMCKCVSWISTPDIFSKIKITWYIWDILISLYSA